MQLKGFILNFILGGAIVSVVSFIGSQGKGLMAAFVAIFPTMTVLTFILIYNKAGETATLHYAKGLIYLTPPWIVYVLCLMYLMPRWGFVKSLVAGVVAYMALSGLAGFIIKRLGYGH